MPVGLRPTWHCCSSIGDINLDECLGAIDDYCVGSEKRVAKVFGVPYLYFCERAANRASRTFANFHHGAAMPVVPFYGYPMANFVARKNRHGQGCMTQH
jgi:hypothetical protein